MLIFSGLLLIPRRWNDESNSPFPKKKEAIERYHNQYHHRSGPLLFCNHHVHLPNGLALRYGVTEPVLETSRTEAGVIPRDEALIVNLYAIARLSQFLTRNPRKWLMLSIRYSANGLRLSPQIDFDRGRFGVVVALVKTSRDDGGSVEPAPRVE